MKKSLKMMMKVRIAIFLMLLPVLAIMLCAGVFAESRSIYIGDIIELKVTAQNYTADELRERFSAFEVVEITEQGGSFILSLRTFETGENRVRLGDKEIVIDVKSTFDEIHRDTVFEGDVKSVGPGFFIKWRYVLFALLPICAVSGAIYFKGRLKSPRAEVLNPYKRFTRQAGSISPDDAEFLVKLTRYLKDYMEAAYSCSVTGRTTDEILVVSGRLPGFREDIRTELGAWLRECDSYKFSGTCISGQTKDKMHKELAELVKRIDAVKGAAS